MKILAVVLEHSGGGNRIPELKSAYIDIVKESDTQYKIAPYDNFTEVGSLINSRSIIKKDEVNTIMFDEGNLRANSQMCQRISMKAWVVVPDVDKRLELVWRQQLKDAAIDEMKSRLRKATGLLRKLENLEADEEE